MPDQPRAPEVPEYVTMKEALCIIGDRFGCSHRTLRRQRIHRLLSRYALGYQNGRTAVRRVPLPAIDEVIKIMHEGRIPEH